MLGCQLRFSYPIVKLQDFTDEIERLNISRNPFATVIASHLRAQASAGNPNVRFGFKVDLVRNLYEKQWQADEIRKLFRFIDWVMDLPETLEIQFMDTVKKIETEKEMTYVTSIERIARREGKAEGNIQLLQELLGIPVSSDAELEQMDAERLQALLKELRQSFNSRAGKQGS